MSIRLVTREVGSKVLKVPAIRQRENDKAVTLMNLFRFD